MLIRGKSITNHTLQAIAIFLIFCKGASTFRLNVPRVLLPYHPDNQVQFQLEVTHPHGGCFAWRSSRTDIVSVEAIENKNAKGCSDKAIVMSRSRHVDQQSAVIFAEEQGGGLTLSCDVTVDLIYSIAITTTTKVLFVDAAPALLAIEAFNKDGDRFSALGNIPFDWFFTYNEGRPLHIIPFSQSKYIAPPIIEELEQQKKKGNMVLVEGISTGSAQISARFHESYFSQISLSSIELFVLANVILVPSFDLYLPVFSSVKYSAILLRKGRTEPIDLPSNQYQLKLDNVTTCDLDIKTSLVTAKSIGSTEIILVDKYMKQRAEFKPRSARIFVVEPDSIQFSISGNNWILQLNVEYDISVKLVDQLGNIMFIPDNAIFVTSIPETYFSILEKSTNGTYFRVISKRAGKLSIKSVFESMLTQNGKKVKVAGVKGEQSLEILTPITIEPEVFLFPFHPNRPYEYRIKAEGGSGFYHWMSADASIAQIEETTGLLRSGRFGETNITAHDSYNRLNRAVAKVIVIEPLEAQFAPSPVEAEIGSQLTLNVKLIGQKTAGLVPFSDCRYVDFVFTVEDPTIFVIDEETAPTLPAGDGCTTVTLIALREGDTKLMINNSRFTTASIDISAYPPLKINVKSSLLLTLGAGIGVTFEGGPRPWVLDNSKYTTSVAAKSVDSASAVIDGSKSFKAFCRNKIVDTEVVLTVGNRKSPENLFPALATAKLKLCCSVPVVLALFIPRMPNGELPVCPAFSHSTYFNAPFQLMLSAQGRCIAEADSETRPFNSINSLNIMYETDKKMLKIEKAVDDSYTDNIAKAIGRPLGVTGFVEIEAMVAHFYDLASTVPTQKVAFPNAQFHAALTLNLVDFARATPSSLVLWNDKSVKGHVLISGGSGHFWLDATAVTERVAATLRGGDKDSVEIEVVPKTSGVGRMTLFDLCIEGSRLDVEVKVIDISGIHMVSSDFVKTSEAVDLKVTILDADKRPFSGVDISDIQVFLSPTGPMPADAVANTVELVLRNLATRQVVRFPVNIKLLTEIAPQQQQAVFNAEKSRSVALIGSSNQYEYAIDSHMLHPYLRGIRELLATFFEGYHTFVVSTVFLLTSVLIFAAAYRYGYLYPIVRGPSSSETAVSNGHGFPAIKQIQPFGFRGKMMDHPVFGERPIFNSTPSLDEYSSSLVDRNSSDSRVSPIMCRSLLTSSQRKSDLDASSRRSAGTDDDPYLWTSHDNSRMHNSSIINRHYK